MLFAVLKIAFNLVHRGKNKKNAYDVRYNIIDIVLRRLFLHLFKMLIDCYYRGILKETCDQDARQFDNCFSLRLVSKFYRPAPLFMNGKMTNNLR